MNKFDGFPKKMDFTPIPNTFINNVMTEISDIGELKVMLYIMEALYNKKGLPRFVAYSELLGDSNLMHCLKQNFSNPENELKEALRLATERKTILCLSMGQDDTIVDLFFLNTEADKQSIEKIKNGAIKIPGIKTRVISPIIIQNPSNIFALYEENIGMLTPIIADELKEAQKIYSETWIEDAIKEAVKQNARKWSYVTAVLERWAKEGRSDGAYRRDSKKDDPEKYTGGKYGHFVQH